jgi:CelD/BcsL family acetyltransferase involved in cellulose biosynthesis
MTRGPGVHADPADPGVEWVTDLSAIASLEGAWRALEREAPSRTVHASWDYVFPWYRHLASAERTPLLGAVRQNGVLVAAAPLVAWHGTLGGVPLRRLDFIAYPWDGGELLLREGGEAEAGRLIRSLARRRGFHVLCLNGQHAGSPEWGSLDAAAGACGLRLVRSDYAIAEVDLGDGFDAYCAAMSQNFRRNHKRMAKRIEAAGGHDLHRLAAGPAGADAGPFLERIFAINDRSWKSREGGPMPAEHRAFNADVIRRFASRGMADIAVLTIGGRDAAYIVALVQGGTYYDFTISFDDEFRDLSPGIFLMIEVLRRIASDGVRKVVSHGAHEYKRRWATRFVFQSRAYFFPPGLRPLLARTARFTVPAWRRRLSVGSTPPGGPGTLGEAP